jgi:hypothetical protein
MPNCVSARARSRFPSLTDRLLTVSKSWPRSSPLDPLIGKKPLVGEQSPLARHRSVVVDEPQQSVAAVKPLSPLSICDDNDNDNNNDDDDDNADGDANNKDGNDTDHSDRSMSLVFEPISATTQALDSESDTASIVATIDGNIATAQQTAQSTGGAAARRLNYKGPRAGSGSGSGSPSPSQSAAGSRSADYHAYSITGTGGTFDLAHRKLVPQPPDTLPRARPAANNNSNPMPGRESLAALDEVLDILDGLEKKHNERRVAV